MHSRATQHRMGVWPYNNRFTSRANIDLGVWPKSNGSGMLAGLWPFTNSSGFSGAPIESVSAALYARVVPNLSTIHKAIITANSSFIPNFLRDYMRENMETAKTYSQGEYYKYWEPKFIGYGYSKDMLPILFGEFRKMNDLGLVPKEIWNPKRYGGFMPPAPSDRAPTVTAMAMKYVPWVLGGIGVLMVVKMSKKRKAA